MIVLAVDVEKKLGAFKLAVRFEAAGGAAALFGPSGSRQDQRRQHDRGIAHSRIAASIALNGTTLFDAAKGINVPPHRRHIGYVFQEGRLFPHLSVRQNVVLWPPHERAAAVTWRRLRPHCQTARYRPPA